MCCPHCEQRLNVCSLPDSGQMGLPFAAPCIAAHPMAVPASVWLEMSLHLGRSDCCWMLLLLSHAAGPYLAVQRAIPFCIIQPDTDHRKLHPSSVETPTTQIPVSEIDFGLPFVSREHKHQFFILSSFGHLSNALAAHPSPCSSHT